MPRPYIQRSQKEWLDIYNRCLRPVGLFLSVTHRQCPVCGGIFKPTHPHRRTNRFCSRKCRNLFNNAQILARKWGVA